MPYTTYTFNKSVRVDAVDDGNSLPVYLGYDATNGSVGFQGVIGSVIGAGNTYTSKSFHVIRNTTGNAAKPATLLVNDTTYDASSSVLLSHSNQVITGSIAGLSFAAGDYIELKYYNTVTTDTGRLSFRIKGTMPVSGNIADLIPDNIAQSDGSTGGVITEDGTIAFANWTTGVLSAFYGEQLVVKHLEAAPV